MRKERGRGSETVRGSNNVRKRQCDNVWKLLTIPPLQIARLAKLSTQRALALSKVVFVAASYVLV